MGPTDAAKLEETVRSSPRYATYSEVVDRESAREILARKLEEGAKADAEEAEARAKEKASPKPSGPRARDDGGAGSVVREVVQSSAFKQFMRTAAAEIARGLFGTARRRRQP